MIKTGKNLKVENSLAANMLQNALIGAKSGAQQNIFRKTADEITNVNPDHLNGVFEVALPSLTPLELTELQISLNDQSVTGEWYLSENPNMVHAFLKVDNNVMVSKEQQGKSLISVYGKKVILNKVMEFKDGIARVNFHPHMQETTKLPLSKMLCSLNPDGSLHSVALCLQYNHDSKNQVDVFATGYRVNPDHVSLKPKMKKRLQYLALHDKDTISYGTSTVAETKICLGDYFFTIIASEFLRAFLEKYEWSQLSNTRVWEKILPTDLFQAFLDKYVGHVKTPSDEYSIATPLEVLTHRAGFVQYERTTKELFSYEMKTLLERLSSTSVIQHKRPRDTRTSYIGYSILLASIYHMKKIDNLRDLEHLSRLEYASLSGFSLPLNVLVLYHKQLLFNPQLNVQFVPIQASRAWNSECKSDQAFETSSVDNTSGASFYSIVNVQPIEDKAGAIGWATYSLVTLVGSYTFAIVPYVGNEVRDFMNYATYPTRVSYFALYHSQPSDDLRGRVPLSSAVTDHFKENTIFEDFATTKQYQSSLSDNKIILTPIGSKVDSPIIIATTERDELFQWVDSVFDETTVSIPVAPVHLSDMEFHGAKGVGFVAHGNLVLNKNFKDQLVQLAFSQVRDQVSFTPSNLADHLIMEQKETKQQMQLDSWVVAVLRPLAQENKIEHALSLRKVFDSYQDESKENMVTDAHMTHGGRRGYDYSHGHGHGHDYGHGRHDYGHRGRRFPYFPIWPYRGYSIYPPGVGIFVGF